MKITIYGWSTKDDGHHGARGPQSRRRVSLTPGSNRARQQALGIPAIRDDTTHPAQPSTSTGTQPTGLCPHFAADIQARIWSRCSSPELADLRLVTAAHSTAERGAESAFGVSCKRITG
jgi:hypothetical protein